MYTYGHRPASDFEGIDKKPPPQARSDRWGRFISDITIVKNKKSAAAKSIMGVMAIAVRSGEEITLTANGTDEQKTIDSLEDFLSNKE